MVNFFDLKHFRQIKKQLLDAAEDPVNAQKVIDTLDENPDWREELSYIYARAKRTVESIKNQDQ